MLLTREQLQDRMMALHRASLELVKDVSLETLLERIAATACEQADARYAALGVLDSDGKLQKFITVGMKDAEIKRIAHRPVGKGLIGELMDTAFPLRVPVIREHPSSVGFPSHHPAMTYVPGCAHSSRGSSVWADLPDREAGWIRIYRRRRKDHSNAGGLCRRGYSKRAHV